MSAGGSLYGSLLSYVGEKSVLDVLLNELVPYVLKPFSYLLQKEKQRNEDKQKTNVYTHISINE